MTELIEKVPVVYIHIEKRRSLPSPDRISDCGAGPWGFGPLLLSSFREGLEIANAGAQITLDSIGPAFQALWSGLVTLKQKVSSKTHARTD